MNVLVISEHESLVAYRGTSLPDGIRIVDVPDYSPAAPVDRLITALDDSVVDVVVLGGDLEDQYILRAAEALAVGHPEMDVIAYRLPDTEFLAAAMKTRVRDVVTPVEDHSTLDQALIRLHEAAAVRRELILARERNQEPTGAITVFGPKGGVGKSTIAVNLAQALAADAPNEVLLIDLDLVGGDVADMLQIDTDFTVARAINNDSPFDPANLKLSLAALPNGPLVLPAPASLVEADHLDFESMELLLKRVVEMFTYVVVDTGPGSTEASLAAISVARQMVITTSPDIGAVRTLVRHIEALDSLGLLPPDRHVVLNQYDRRSGIGTADIEAALGRTIDFTLPPDRTVQAAANEGVPYLQNRSRGAVAAALYELANAVRGEVDIAEEPVRSKGWFR